MNSAIAVLNSGSSSIKFSLYEARGTRTRVRGQLEAIHTAPRFVARDAAGNTVAEKTWSSGTPLGHDGALDYIVAHLRSALGGTPLAAVGHRVVHGGMHFDAPARVDSRVLGQLEHLIPLAPLHQPHNLAPIRRLLERAPSVPQVACFDTAFHRTQPEVAQMFGLPRTYHDEGVRRFGFHGLSYEYIASQLLLTDAVAARGRTIVLHLGNGASMCALLEGRSVATTMGFTAVDGLLMGTRCGALDPGVILYLMETHRMDARAVERLIYQHSGLLGVSGVSSDMRTLLASPEPGARVAIDLYIHRIRREMGALAAALGGVDAIVFTGGVGENAAAIRARVCRDAAWLGVDLDPEANAAGASLVTSAASRVKAWRLATDEEGVIARHTHRLTSREPVAEDLHA
ncbi:MAG TPA: acetate/propionate family kinase [Usitatibacter sp.]|jgi:acetate kinase|nr:acetate/propionate family kinase [Usitatibacter sp.]